MLASRKLYQFSSAVDTDVRLFLEAGYGERHILEIVLAVAVKTLSNYTNHLFQTPVDAMFAARAWTLPTNNGAPA